MIETWNVAPPEPRRHIVHIAKLDMAMFSAPVVAAADWVLGITVRGPDVTLERPGITSTMSLSESTPYLVTFSDGKVARTSYETLRQALEALGQFWIPERW